MFVPAIVGYDKKTGEQKIITGTKGQTHADLYEKAILEIDIPDDSAAYGFFRGGKFYTRDKAVEKANKIADDLGMKLEGRDLSSSESYVDL